VVQHLEEGMTLSRYLFETSKSHPEATGQFVTLLQAVTLASKVVSSRVNRAGLSGILGGTGEVNIQGEFVQKLDLFANDQFKKALEHQGVCAMVVSEEDDEPTWTPDRFQSGRYIFCMDPLDGSSNIDVNATIGTIFGVFRRQSDEGGRATIQDALQPGHSLVAAGYVIYGSGTLLVLATEDSGVNGFTLDPGVGEYYLSHPNIRLEDESKMYSINEAYSAQWSEGLRAYIDSLKALERDSSMRYIGSLVADFHRNLLKGGVFLYPATTKAPKGKLRLIYEAFPLAFICELAGGKASDGAGRILDRCPTTLHERTPLIIGNRANVEEACAFLADDV
jgi:fructose-1,6-bisphosphatase I